MIHTFYNMGRCTFIFSIKASRQGGAFAPQQRAPRGKHIQAAKLVALEGGTL